VLVAENGVHNKLSSLAAGAETKQSDASDIVGLSTLATVDRTDNEAVHSPGNCSVPVNLTL